MRKIAYRPYFLLILLFFSVMSFPKEMSEKMRSIVIASVSPCWKGLHFFKEGSLNLLTAPFFGTSQNSRTNSLELERLSQENLMLRSQVANVRDWLLYEDRIQEQLERLKSASAALVADPDRKDFFKRRTHQLAEVLDLQVQSLPGKVVFREPSSWSSSMWIGLGEKNNRGLGKKIVCKNSPVLVGTSIIGVVEYVGATQSRVRLITDSRLTPSVRALRGQEQNRYLIEHLDTLLFSLEVRDDLLEDKAQILGQLYQLKNLLSRRTEELYLAKGELHGASNPLWRSRGQILYGIGFNYDFADQEGLARDLRSGTAYGSSARSDSQSILKAGDLLVTTGLDGVFPAGLRVAVVSKIKGLKEGASSYELEAISTAGNLDEITHVFVLPPLSGAEE